MAAVRGFEQLERTAPALQRSARLHQAIAATHRVCAAIDACEAVDMSRDEIRDRVRSTREIFGRSPFVERLQRWPRGYAGDFETIEWLWQQVNRAEQGTLAHALEQYALDAAIAQQHRNKVTAQGRLIVDVATRPRPAAPPRILSVACGGCPDLRSVAATLGGRELEVVLVDQDLDALVFAKSELGPTLGSRLTPIVANVVKEARMFRTLGRFDAIVMGGLLDYLPDRIASFLLGVLVSHALAPGGTLLATNIGAGNPFRTWMEHCADWTLIERTEADLARLLTEALSGRQPKSLAVEREGTGLALLARVTVED